jgi:hypothetical protein
MILMFALNFKKPVCLIQIMRITDEQVEFYLCLLQKIRIKL